MNNRIVEIPFRAFAACLCTSAVAWASEEGGAGGGGIGDTLPVGDIWNSIATLVTFGLVIFVLGKFAWKPLLKVLKDREDFIRQSLQSARKDRQDAENTLQKYKEQLDQSRAEATAIVNEGRRDAEVVRHKVQEEARQEAEAIIHY